ncbi:MAG: hypothetical protein PVSMB8_13070 [Vulcanimicrobiaceae bacterium]
MKAVSNMLVAAVVAAAVFAIAPHRGTTKSTVIALATPQIIAARVKLRPVTNVDTKDYAFEPSAVTIAAGETVAFRNSDSAAHAISATEGSFDSGNMKPNSTWTHTFAKPGTYGFHCEYHRYMRGVIIVK